MKLPLYLLELVNEIQKLPGIGNKTATRLALFLLQSKSSNSISLANKLIEGKNRVRLCNQCGALSEDNLCPVCSDIKRNRSRICIVETISDMIAIEKTGYYDGLYHVLGGVVSPVDSIYESDLNIKSLFSRLEDVNEIIFAIPSGIESDTTFLILKKRLNSEFPKIRVSRVAVGLPIGGNIDFIDDLTLIKAFENRIEG